MSVNKIILLGRIGNDVELHYFEGGGSVGRVALATSDSYKNKATGEVVTNTEWHNLVFKNKAAETVEKHLKRGDQVYVEGIVRYKMWESGDGLKHYKTEIHVDTFTFLPNKKD